VHHLNAVLERQPRHLAANKMLAQAYIEKADWDQAARHLAVAAEADPRLGFLLAELHVRRGAKPEATAVLKRTEDHFREQAEDNPREVEPRLNWARACLMQNGLQRTEKILRDGLAKRDDPAYRNALAAVYAQQIDQLSNPASRKVQANIQLLELALNCSPNSADALRQLASWSDRRQYDTDFPATALEQMLVLGKSLATVHLVLGLHALDSEDSVSAQRHLGQAVRLDPRTLAVLNNLALYLVSGEARAPERAMRIIGAAIDLAPGQAELLATRGRILVALQRYSEALPDLQAVVEAMPRVAHLHEFIAQVYQQLGDPEAAQRHRDLAKACTDSDASR
jgi:tetratricopeptide (TPR) repeat protein